ncbi:SDR family oxidoreductase [Pediococcus pentosaceus]|uniref:SDR family oxidoreductase n=1 Tax=Pediococcus pentosaceus TaxID=1255 RepID=A0AB73HHA5_PEDPE|nr:SDR family oxidoreductase [Pediococcus pentosaceus]MBF7114681.1 SDR family oxidoreductase [Pediococcus pentosaceus]MDN3206437.1 SDR family oxidoreductase [Pediococcus pentosaceus]
MKFALICGASGNIGTAISKDLAQKGWSLYLHYYQNEATTNQLANELRAEYPQQDFLTIQANFRSEDAAQKISKNIFGLNAVVFAQGTTIYQLFGCFSAQQLENLWQEQLKTPMLVIQKVIKKISNAENGRIVFIGSIYGAVGSSMEVPYSAIKGGISSFVNAYSKEVASLGVTVNAVAPGAVSTKMNDEFNQTEIEAVNEEIPVGRFGDPSEISHIVQSIMDERASYLTGQTIYVDGGWKK